MDTDVYCACDKLHSQSWQPAKKVKKQTSNILPSILHQCILINVLKHILYDWDLVHSNRHN